MGFQEEMQAFERTHTFEKITVQGHTFGCLLCGNEESRYTLVYLVGGAGRPAAWLRHVTAMEKDYRVLVLDYPADVNEVEPLVHLISALLTELNIEKGVFVGASFGGYLAQLLAKYYPEKTQAIALYSTSSLSGEGIAGLRKQYGSYRIILWAIKHLPYDLLKNLLMKTTAKLVSPKDGPEAAAYMKDFFKWLYGGYTREFDIHMTSLIMDIVNITPVTADDFSYLEDRILMILPLEDKAFTEEMQQELMDMMPGARKKRLAGGHTATIYKVDEYVAETREFLTALGQKG